MTVVFIGRQYIVESVRRDVLSSRVCTYCGDRATSVDHDIPVCRGGTNARSNLLPACWPCNLRKGTRTGAEYRESLIVNASLLVHVDKTVKEITPLGTADSVDDLIVAGRIIAERSASNRQSLQKSAKVLGLLVLALREQGFSWRQIQDQTGIIQKNGDRWTKKYLDGGSQL
jgi:hypothetical protein